MKTAITALALSVALFGGVDARRRPNEVWTREQEEAAGIIPNNYIVGTAPHETLDSSDLPQAYN